MSPHPHESSGASRAPDAEGHDTSPGTQPSTPPGPPPGTHPSAPLGAPAAPASPATDAEAPPGIVFVHGLRTSSAIWEHQARAARAAGYETRAVDLPGHGARRGERFSGAAALDAVDEAVGSLPTGSRYALVGLSLGGYTALAHASARPSPRLAAVVAAACSTDPSTKPVGLYRHVADGVARTGSAVERRLWLLRARRDARSAADVAAAELALAARRARRESPATTVWAGGPRPRWDVVTDALRVVGEFSTIQALRRFDAPVLLVNGQWDHLRWEERRHRSARPGIDLTVIRGASHDVSLDAPVRFNRAMLDFLARTRDGSPAAAEAPRN